MIAIEIDYHNLQFHLYRDGRVVIEQVIRDCSESIARKLNERVSSQNINNPDSADLRSPELKKYTTDPDVQRQSAVH